MGRVTKVLKNLWLKLDGKKTSIGIAGHTVWLVVNLAAPKLADATQQNIGHLIIGHITGVGLGHKTVKAIKGTFFKKILNWVGRLIKKV